MLARVQAEKEAKQPPDAPAAVTMASPTAAKIALFRSLFRGREDVLPRRWENPKTGKAGYAPMCRNEWVRGVCAKPQVRCRECPNQAFIPLGDDILRSHLAGKASGSAADFTVGVYPMLPDETCWFLAADFDKKSWMQDVAALVTATMDRCPDIGFDSYDRFFPSQDTMPVGGFGNLIVLPLQSRPRENGNSVFVDDDFRPYKDQWAYLSRIRRLSRGELTAIVAEAAATGQIIGVRLPPTEEQDEPWAALPSRRRRLIPLSQVARYVV